MANRESNPAQPNGHVRSRPLLLGALVILFAIAALVAAVLVNRYVVLEIEEAKGYRSVLVHTPFGFLLAPQSKSARFSLWTAVYPESNWGELNSFSFYRGPEGREEKVGQLTVLRFTTKASVQQVTEWYQQRLSESFVRTKGWFVGRNDKYDWVQRVAGNSDPDAVVYRRELPGRTQGVVLATSTAGTSVALYDFQQGER